MESFLSDHGGNEDDLPDHITDVKDEDAHLQLDNIDDVLESFEQTELVMETSGLAGDDDDDSDDDHDHDDHDYNVVIRGPAGEMARTGARDEVAVNRRTVARTRLQRRAGE